MKKALMVYEECGMLSDIHMNVREQACVVDTAASHSEVVRKMNCKKYDYIFIHEAASCKQDIIKDLQKDSERFFNPQNQKPIRYFSAENNSALSEMLGKMDEGLFVITN